MIKKLLLISCVLLCACKPGSGCQWDYDRDLQIKLYRECLSLSASARKGQSYTTDDDEDFDEVISQCSTSAKYQALLEDTICGKENRGAQP